MSSVSEDFVTDVDRTTGMQHNRVDSFLDDMKHEDVSLSGLVTMGLVGSIALLGLHAVASIVSSGLTHGMTMHESLAHVPDVVWDSYTKVLSSNPICTKACTSGAVYAIGDLIAQRTEGGVDDIDQMRVARSMMAGFIGHGPMSHFWYIACDGFFENVLHMTDWWSFIPKIVVDQSFWGPIWNNSYIILLGLMKRESMEKMVSDVKTSTIPLVLSGLKLWPLAHVITYGLIPTENRLLWVDLVEILWVTILATQAASLSRENELPSSLHSSSNDEEFVIHPDSKSIATS